MNRIFYQLLIIILVMMADCYCFALDNFINANEVEFEVEEIVTLEGLPSASEPAVSPANGGRLYFNSDDDAFKVSLNGAAYEELATGSGGDFSDGGDTEGANRTLGNKDAFSLGFLTDNATRLTIDSVGNIGIGTTSPGALLDVRGNVIFNEDAANADFRVEGTGEPNLLFVDASADAVGVGTASPGATLDVRGGAVFNEDGDSVDFRIEGDVEQNLLFVDASVDSIGIGTSSPGSTLDVRGSAIFNEDGDSVDFRVEGDTEQNLLFVDGSADFVGLGTSSPAALLHGDEGGLVFTGTTGVTPVSGTGTRMMWIPAKAAFRAGQVVSTQWDDVNVGTGSVVLGRFSEATALNSIAIGPNNTASNTAAVTLGSSATASALSAMAIGKDVTASGTSAVAIGEFVTAGAAANAIAIGRGANAANNLVNNVANSFMVGMNSNLPTLTVGPSTGIGTTGNVGIATSSPSNRFDIQASGEIVELGDGSASDIVINFDEGADRNFGWDDSEDSISTFDEQLRFRTRQGSTPPVACSSTVAGMNWFDTDTGLLYICDTSNSRNKWLTSHDMILWGEQNGGCGNNQTISTDEGCSVEWGASLGAGNPLTAGFYIAHPITIVGYGFSKGGTTLNCGGDSFDIEVWGTGSNSDDGTFTDPTSGSPTESAVVDTGLTTDHENAIGLNVDIDGDQYIAWGLRNNACGNIADWNMQLYYRWRHD